MIKDKTAENVFYIKLRVKSYDILTWCLLSHATADDIIVYCRIAVAWLSVAGVYPGLVKNLSFLYKKLGS